MTRADWYEIVWNAHQKAFEDAPNGWRIDIFQDGGMSEPLTGGTEVYCKSHGMHERCPHCRVVASIEGFDALDVSVLYETDDDDNEKDGYVYDRELQDWVEKKWDEISIYVEDWVEDEVGKILSYVLTLQ